MLNKLHVIVVLTSTVSAVSVIVLTTPAIIGVVYVSSILWEIVVVCRSSLFRMAGCIFVTISSATWV